MSIHINLLNDLTGARPENLPLVQGEAFNGVSIDTRTLQPGELFIAIRGDRFDGHEFVKQAFDGGATAAMVDSNWIAHGPAEVKGRPLIGVPDTIKALGELARAHRRCFEAPVIAIAGSNGKTSTKELVASVLSQRWRVLKTEGTLNNHIGVPLTLLQMEATHQAAVVELGMNHLGEIATLCRIAEPTHGLITNIMREHLEFLHTLENVARAECELFDWLIHSDGTVFLNLNEPLLVARAHKLTRFWRYGFHVPDADTRGTNHGIFTDGCGRLGVECHAKNAVFEARVGLVGPHQIRNALAAAAVGLYFEIDPHQIQAALANQQPPKHRMNVFHVGGVTFLDDTYNANPDSMLAALQTLAALPCQGRRLAALGNMGELGEQSEAYHREIGTALRKMGIHGLFTIGDLAKSIFETAAPSVGTHCENHGDLLRHLKTTMQPGDVLLLKASRSMKLDQVMDELRKTLEPVPSAGR